MVRVGVRTGGVEESATGQVAGSWVLRVHFEGLHEFHAELRLHDQHAHLSLKVLLLLDGAFVTLLQSIFELVTANFTVVAELSG